MTERLLSVAEVAEATGEPEATIRRWIYEGVLPVDRVGPTRRVRVRLTTLCQFFPRETLRLDA